MCVVVCGDKTGGVMGYALRGLVRVDGLGYFLARTCFWSQVGNGVHVF